MILAINWLSTSLATSLIWQCTVSLDIGIKSNSFASFSWNIVVTVSLYTGRINSSPTDWGFPALAITLVKYDDSKAFEFQRPTLNTTDFPAWILIKHVQNSLLLSLASECFLCVFAIYLVSWKYWGELRNIAHNVVWVHLCHVNPDHIYDYIVLIILMMILCLFLRTLST